MLRVKCSTMEPLGRKLLSIPLCSVDGLNVNLYIGFSSWVSVGKGNMLLVGVFKICGVFVYSGGCIFVQCRFQK